MKFVFNAFCKECDSQCWNVGCDLAEDKKLWTMHIRNVVFLCLQAVSLCSIDEVLVDILYNEPQSEILSVNKETAHRLVPLNLCLSSCVFEDFLGSAVNIE
jgi:hypothetical protein